MKQKKTNKNKGFTLVEVIVVLVVLAILAAILVPTMIKYIDKANKKASIAECRQVVLAAQGTSSELYAHKNLIELNTPDTKSEILELAEVKGYLLDDINESSGTITWLKYKCENGTVVIYDISKEPPYIIEKEPSYLTILNQFVKDADQWTHQYMEDNNIKSPDRQKTILEFMKNNGGKLPEVTAEQKAGTAFENKDLYWKPYYIGSGSDSVSILFANSSDSNHGAWTGNLIYMDGVIYEAKNPATNNIHDIYQGNSSYNDVRKWLDEHNYKPVKR